MLHRHLLLQDFVHQIMLLGDIVVKMRHAIRARVYVGILMVQKIKRRDAKATKAARFVHISPLLVFHDKRLKIHHKHKRILVAVLVLGKAHYVLGQLSAIAFIFIHHSLQHHSLNFLVNNFIILLSPPNMSHILINPQMLLKALWILQLIQTITTKRIIGLPGLLRGKSYLTWFVEHAIWIMLL